MKQNSAQESRTGGTGAPGADVLAGLHVEDCYQCGKCTAGCPVATRWNHVPNRVIRLVQLGDLKGAVRTESIWHCVSCLTCTLRCPKSVDCAGVMDALRQLAVTGEHDGPVRNRVVVFYQAFLNNLRRNGRLHELGLVGQFKANVVLREMNLPFLFKDALLAPRMMKRGKLHFAPGRVRDRAVVGRIFTRCLESRPVAAERKVETAHP